MLVLHGKLSKVPESEIIRDAGYGYTGRNPGMQAVRIEREKRYTVPVGIGVNRTFQFGKVPARIGLEYFKTAISPDDVVASDWSVRFYVIPAVPSALFSWMQ